MNTSTPRVLSGAEVRALSVRSNVRGAARTALHGGALALAGVGVALSGPWTLPPAMLLLGALNWHFYTAFHLAHHRFTQDPERDGVVQDGYAQWHRGYLLSILRRA